MTRAPDLNTYRLKPETIVQREGRLVYLTMPSSSSYLTMQRGDDMISYLYRLIQQFERQHGIHPNLLYLNEIHAEKLKQDFSDELPYHSITDLLKMELVINKEITHPHVAWTHTAQSMAV